MSKDPTNCFVKVFFFVAEDHKKNNENNYLGSFMYSYMQKFL